MDVPTWRHLINCQGFHYMYIVTVQKHCTVIIISNREDIIIIGP